MICLRLSHCGNHSFCIWLLTCFLCTLFWTISAIYRQNTSYKRVNIICRRTKDWWKRCICVLNAVTFSISQNKLASLFEDLKYWANISYVQIIAKSRTHTHTPKWLQRNNHTKAMWNIWFVSSFTHRSRSYRSNTLPNKSSWMTLSVASYQDESDLRLRESESWLLLCLTFRCSSLFWIAKNLNILIRMFASHGLEYIFHLMFWVKRSINVVCFLCSR